MGGGLRGKLLLGETPCLQVNKTFKCGMSLPNACTWLVIDYRVLKCALVYQRPKVVLIRLLSFGETSDCESFVIEATAVLCSFCNTHSPL